MVSDDGSLGLVIIGFIGSVFSPFYARARRKGGGQADPSAHVGLNVVLYGPGGTAPKKRWAFTERDAASLARTADTLTLGPNSLAWEGDTLVARFDERAAPFGQRLAGEVRLTPERLFGPEVHLDAQGRHRWWPVAPVSRAQVRLSHPDVSFEGGAYHDANQGAEPLEAGFTHWAWSRQEGPEGTTILYDAERTDGSSHRWGRRFGRDGQMTPVEAPAQVELPTTGWRLPRATRVATGGTASLVRTYEDTPFYSRSLLKVGGDAGGYAVHEGLDLRRFDARWVQFLLPFRMRRALG